MSKSTKLLLIDDNPGDRSLFRYLLQKSTVSDYAFIEAETGDEGLAEIDRFEFGCVLLDYSLPGHNGLEILTRIRSAHPYLPVIMLTGMANEEIAVVAMQAGAQNYLAKATITSQSVEHVIQGAVEHCEMHKRLADQRESLEIFSRALAHDLKEPLRTMRSMLDVIQEEATFPGETIGYFQSVQNCAVRITSLIDTVRAYTQADGPQRAVCNDCNANQVVETALDNIGALVKERHAVIEVGALPRIFVNRTQTIQVFQNPLSNAIRHCETTPKIAISGIETANTWQFKVSDNGPGVSEEETAKLFKPFTRFSRNDTQGLGLGLAICKKLMDLHRGRIWYEPPSGSGATFSFSFPKDVAYV
jgi:signal transduction histidine kinase